MEDRAQVEAVILKFFEALNIDDASGVPLAEDAEYHGMLSPEPIRGEIDVRDHIQQIAPFLLNEKYSKLIVEGGSAAVMAAIDSVNGIHSEGAYFFEVEHGQIKRIRAMFDTRRIFEGKKR